MFLLCCFLAALTAHAQDNGAAEARQHMAKQEYQQAIELFANLYDKDPVSFYNEYFEALLTAKDFKKAEKLVNSRIDYQSRNPLLYIDKGHLLELQGKTKKAEEQYMNVLQLVNGDDMITSEMVNKFVAIGKDNYAVGVYERAKSLLGGTFIYNIAMAKLYAKLGDIDKALNALIDMGPVQYINTESAKGAMLEILGADAAKLQLTQKALMKKINQQPDNTYYVELLTWLYTQKNDWEGALLQIEALEERGSTKGQRLLEFARAAANEKQFDIALKSYTDVIEKGAQLPYYIMARSEKLNTQLLQLQNDAQPDAPKINQLLNDYDSFLVAFPQYYSTSTAQDYAMVAAQYANNPQKGINILEKAAKQNNVTREFWGKCTLQLADYQILTGKIWEASLLYSQVDKEFKQDALGEEARFRNAKVAYYTGDFDWAQGQLSVLKASTSELIANDALFLSVLLTENKPEDSNYVPLQRFAYADLLLFQNKDKDAEQLLDSLNQAYPKHPLNDDILMLRAKIALKHKDYNKALAYLKIVFEQYGKDVLGDDAVYQTAEIYETKLHDLSAAKKFYEQLIIDYPGSTFSQSARKHLELISKGTLP